MEEIKALANLQADSISGWGGSITFLQKYVSQALKRIEYGPRNWVDPKEEFINQDKIEYCGSKCKLQETKNGEKCFICNICKEVNKDKRFMSLQFAIKHIQTKHNDVIEETYSKESTRDWIEKTVKEKFKKEMKQNYYNDENKLFNQPGRKYSQAESSYYTRGDGSPRGDRRGGYRGRGRGGFNRYQKEYVDYDDPDRQQTKERAKDREQVDYSDLFS